MKHRFMTADQIQAHMDRFIARHPYSSRYFGGPAHPFRPDAHDRAVRRQQYHAAHKRMRAVYRRRKKGLAV